MKPIVAILIIAYSCSASADVTKTQKPEVAHLLNFVKTSSCEINRNGTYHKGSEAVSHIEKKYDYFRDKINTTEEFIEYSATKSAISGKYYSVRCGNGEVIKTKEWLLNELKIYREIKRT